MKNFKSRKNIEQYIEWAFAEFGLAPATLKVKFERESIHDKKAAMCATADYPYRNYTITVYDNAQSMTKENIKHCVHHELIHFILDEICYVRQTNNRDEWRCALEKAVDHLSYLIKL